MKSQLSFPFKSNLFPFDNIIQIMALDELLSQLSGLPTDQIRFIIGNLLCIGLCFNLPHIKDPKQRSQYSTIFGTLLQFYIYADEPIKMAIICLVSVMMYYVTSLSRREKAGRNVTILAIALLTFYHIYRLITDYGSWRIDAATAFMMMVCKYSSFAFAYQDGGMPVSSLFGEQEKNMIVELPTLKQYLDYIQFLPTAALGPTLEYREYEKYMNQQDQYKSIPSTWQQTRSTFFQSMLYISIYMIICPLFPLTFVLTRQFSLYPWHLNILYTTLSVNLLRSKYYFAWKLSSCSLDACGITYAGTRALPSGEVVYDWSLIPTCNPWVVETSIHLRDRVKSWNMSVQGWLQKCIYHRYRRPEEYKKDKSSMARGQLLVFAVSAFWHGLYLGYYLAFFFWFNLTGIINSFYKISTSNPSIQTTFKKSGFLGQFLAWFSLNVCFSYIGSYFMLLSLPNCVTHMRALNFIPNVLILVVNLALQKVAGVLGRGDRRKREVAAAVGEMGQEKVE